MLVVLLKRKNKRLNRLIYPDTHFWDTHLDPPVTKLGELGMLLVRQSGLLLALCAVSRAGWSGSLERFSSSRKLWRN